MIRALMTAASGMKSQQLQVDTIANNIANVNTTGFKKNEITFRDMLYQTLREPGAPTGATSMAPTGLQIGSGAEIASSVKVFSQGEIEPTASDFDLAISGQGFFRLLLENGEQRFTRSGSFRPDGNGALVTPEGYRLDPSINYPPNAIKFIVGEDGTVSFLESESEEPQIIGNISLFRFPNPTGLKAQGGNLYTQTASSGAPQQVNPGVDGTGVVRQKALERSNVQVVDELVSLILAQRNYEVNSRAIRVSDEMLSQLNQIVR